LTLEKRKNWKGKVFFKDSKVIILDAVSVK
jgi:hypothetical protein